MSFVSHIVAATIAIGVAGPIAYVAFDRSPCVTLKPFAEDANGRPILYLLETPEVYPGEPLKWRIKVDRYAVCEYRRTSYMGDGANEVRNYEPVELGSDGEGGNDKEYLLTEIVPPGAAPGEAEYFRWGHYRRSVANDYWPLPPVLLGHLRYTILESKEGE